MRVTDRIINDIDTILDRGTYGMPIDYEIQVGMIPTENGNMIIAQFFFFTRNPILGQGDLAVLEIMPLEMTKVEAALEALVRRCLENLLDQKDEATGLRKKP